jgi:four helix bundle protein
MEKGYKKLIVWQKADELAYQIYLETKKFPKEEIYGVTSQLRRAAISVPLNIVEGAGRQNKNELKQFLNIALGSLSETEYLLEFCFRLKYLNADTYNKLESLRNEVGALLWNFHKTLTRDL